MLDNSKLHRTRIGRLSGATKISLQWADSACARFWVSILVLFAMVGRLYKKAFKTVNSSRRDCVGMNLTIAFYIKTDFYDLLRGFSLVKVEEREAPFLRSRKG